MTALFATSPDGRRVAYDVNGTGPAIMLLHGGGRIRQDWHAAGYIERLSRDSKVITVDLRGHGESDQPTDPAYYTIDKMGQDLIAVADACGVDCFTIWGLSYGGNVSRYLAARSERVAKIILMGTRFGLGVSGHERQYAEELIGHWTPISQTQIDGTLDLKSLSADDQDFLRRFKLPVVLAWVKAMLDWPAIEPVDLRCPALWLVGSNDTEAMDSVKEYKASLKGSKIQLRIVEGLDHNQVLTEIDEVLPIMLGFTQS